MKEMSFNEKYNLIRSRRQEELQKYINSMDAYKGKRPQDISITDLTIIISNFHEAEMNKAKRLKTTIDNLYLSL